MRTLLLSTAMVAASTLGASAQDLFRGEAAPDEIRGSDLMGMRVYASEAAVDSDEIEGLQEGWEDIGEINDIVLSRDGSVEAVLVDVGGFLGIGERQVAVSMDQLRMVSDSATPDDVGDYFLVINADRATIEGAPDYMAGAMAADASADQAEAVADASAEAGAAGTEPTDEVVTETAEGDMATDMDASETAENAVEETGEEVADAGAEVADEVSDAGEEVAEEAGQVGMTDGQEDVAEAADAQADATEESAEEMAQADAEMADEQADTAEAVAEGNVEGMTETETESMDTAAAATDETATTDMASTDTAMATDDAAATEMADGAAVGERTPMSREGYVALGADQMTADNLEGAAVYDANDERVGEVGELLIDDQGMITNVVLDIGGFLGIGEKPVSLPMDSLDILQQDGGDDLRIYVSQTREELEAMETYSEAQ